MSRHRPRRLPLRRRLIYLAIMLLGFCVLVEGASRLFWAIQGLPFWSAQRHLPALYYDRLDALRAMTIPEGYAHDNTFDILLLGGSVVNPLFGPVELNLMEGLNTSPRRMVRVFNLAEPGLTTLDSFYKYRYMAGRKFDLVIVYHGINETRANNVPAAIYRDDYSHYSWYRRLNVIMDGLETRWLAAPVTLHLGWITVAERLGLLPTVSRDQPTDPEWIAQGASIKTARAFAENLEKIESLVQARQERLMVMTFATYVPDDYTSTRFERHQLDYRLHWFGAEIWGALANVEKGVAAHNEAIRRFAAVHPEVVFVDQARLMPREGRYFNDLCHLSLEGCRVFAENMLPAIRPLIEQWSPVDPPPPDEAAPTPSHAGDDVTTGPAGS